MFEINELAMFEFRKNFQSFLCAQDIHLNTFIGGFLGFFEIYSSTIKTKQLFLQDRSGDKYNTEYK